MTAQLRFYQCKLKVNLAIFSFWRSKKTFWDKIKFCNKTWIECISPEFATECILIKLASKAHLQFLHCDYPMLKRCKYPMLKRIVRPINFP